jgi:hypothetical protein
VLTRDENIRMRDNTRIMWVLQKWSR